MANQYNNLGEVAQTRGDLVKARSLWVQSRDLFAEIGAAHMVQKVQSWIDDLDWHFEKKRLLEAMISIACDRLCATHGYMYESEISALIGHGMPFQICSKTMCRWLQNHVSRYTCVALHALQK